MGRANGTLGALWLAAFLGGGAIAATAAADDVVQVTPSTFLSELESRRSSGGRLHSGTRFVLAPGRYRLAPRSYNDPTCGNCEDPFTAVHATVGLLLSGDRIEIRGSGPETVIQTGAGYGLLFSNCLDCLLGDLTVTGGVRDPDGQATDAAVVVRHSSVHIEDCTIRDNVGDSASVAQTIVGIMGIAGREGSELVIRGNRIVRNSWDGIALYRGARALIVDNVIDGVDKATGSDMGGGRGVGIGVTWNAEAVIHRNLVTRYWKGIGVFVDARAEITGNVVEDIITWGIAFWDAGRGLPVARIERNIIFETGACGLAVTRAAAGSPEPGFCRMNIVARTGLNPKYDDPESYCLQCPLAPHAVPDGFILGENLFFANRRAGDCPFDPDLATCAFRAAALPLVDELKTFPALRAARCFGDLSELIGVTGCDGR